MTLTQAQANDRIERYVDAPIGEVPPKVWNTPVSAGVDPGSAGKVLSGVAADTAGLLALVKSLGDQLNRVSEQLNRVLVERREVPTPEQTAISLDKLWSFTAAGAPATDQRGFIIPFCPPRERTEEALIYAIQTCKKARLELYGFGNENIIAAIIGRIRESKTTGGRPFDVRVQSNHDSYISLSGVKDTAGGAATVIDAKNSDGSWKYPEFHTQSASAPWFVLSSSEYRLDQTKKPAVDGSRRIDHRKMGIFDDCLVFTGSTNWDDSSNNKQGNELHFIFDVADARSLTEAFDSTWQGNINRGPGFYLAGL